MIAIGRRVYGLGAIGLALVSLKYGDAAAVWLPAPAHMPGRQILVYALIGLLLLAGLAINLARTAALGALVLAAIFALTTLVLRLPDILAGPTDWGGWENIAEAVAMALGGVLAWTQTPGINETRAGAVARFARLAFGACLVIFGISHFVYAKFTASLVPAWLPPSQMFWADATGLAQIAAGLAMLSGVQARLAAILLTVMYAGFGLLVHIPSIVAAPHVANNWSENAINFLLLGAAWTLADSLGARKGVRVI